MSALQVVGSISIALVAVFTWAAARGGVAPRAALMEAWLNILLGFAFNWVANLLLLPLVGAHASPGANFWLGWPYTVVSMMRQFAIRHWLGARIHAIAAKFS